MRHEDMQGRLDYHLSVLGLFEPSKIALHVDKFPDFDCNSRDGDLELLTKLCIPLDKAVESCFQFDMISGDFSAIKYSRLGEARDSYIRNFRDGIRFLKRFYDYIVIDCNPSASFLSNAALEGCDHILAPIKPDNYGRRGLTFIRRAIDDFFAPPRPPEITVVFNMCRPNAPRHEEQMKDIIRGRLAVDKEITAFVGHEFFLGKILQTEIPKSDALRSKLGVVGLQEDKEPFARALIKLAGTGPVNQALWDMTDEYARRLDGVQPVAS